jgi:hypothetical protein
VEKLPFYSRLIFSIHQQNNFNWFVPFILSPCGISDVRYQLARQARCTPQTYSVVIRGSFLVMKRPGHEADRLPLSSAEVKNEWS